MKVIKPLLIGTVLILASCQDKSENKYEKLEKMTWLIGQWENKSPEGLLTETWTKDNDSTFSGQTYFIKNEKDTLHSESIVLTQTKEALIYRPTVKGQNNDQPVDFKLTSDLENSFTFENPKHDYPQKIVYKKLNDKSLVATISGIQQGKQSSESYPMKKK
ncbi:MULTISPECIES: DUF6265 family protein [unclassified Flavobacterium]|uniref:DUF6265 family protein n=1 Tax=unclassified Flavobacterium TaxID=196869 RepID=UPI000EAE9A39|nr:MULTISPECIES: DUF6265 family protein [unclassified Flavobacterium]RKS02419.1 hypothetical protein C8C84_2135 [Flavobacterium sp. 102]